MEEWHTSTLKGKEIGVSGSFPFVSLLRIFRSISADAAALAKSAALLDPPGTGS